MTDDLAQKYGDARAKARELLDELRRHVDDAARPNHLAEGPFVSRDLANYLLARRTIDFAGAGLDLSDSGRVGPLAAVVRGALETTIVWRWVLEQPDDEMPEPKDGEEPGPPRHVWFRKGDAQIRFEGSQLAEAHEAAGAPFDEGWRALIDGIGIKDDNLMPFKKWSQGSQLYAAFYPRLSGLAHPNAVSTWRYLDEQPDPVGELLVVVVALMWTLVDAIALFRAWTADRTVAPPPSILMNGDPPPP